MLQGPGQRQETTTLSNVIRQHYYEKLSNHGLEVYRSDYCMKRKLNRIFSRGSIHQTVETTSSHIGNKNQRIAV